MNGISNGGGMPLFSSANNSNALARFQSSAASKPVDEYWKDDFRPLRDAGKGILRMLRTDETSANSDLYRRIISSTSNSRSNSNGADVETNPAHHYFFPGSVTTTGKSENNKKFVVDDNASTIKHIGTIPLPPELEEKRKKVKLSTMMGLFPQGQLAWLTIDDTVYLWSYNSSLDGTSDGAADVGMSSQTMYHQMDTKQTILSVGLAKPKPGKKKHQLKATS